jgi:predicted ribosome quality control (RQC) complex YloA/Tae2 family protein
MLNNYFTIREVAKYMDENISGYFIDEIFTQEKNKLFINLINDEKRDAKILEYSIEKGNIYLVLKENFSKAKKNYVNLFQEVYGEKIIGVSLYNDDRAVNFKLTDENEMIFTFFSNKANCFLTDKSVIINSFKDKDEYFNKNISEVIPLKEKITPENTSDLTLEKYLKLNYRTYGDLFFKEILLREKLNGKEIINEEKIKDIEKGFRQLNEELIHPVYLLYSKGNEFIISLIKFNQFRDYELKEFGNINSLISEYLKLKFRFEKIISIKQNKLDEINKKLSRVAKKMQSLNVQLAHCEDSEIFKSFGNAILQNIHLIKKGDKLFSFESSDGKKHQIKLKENLSPAENAQDYFEKYKKQKGSLEILESKINVLKKDMSKLEAELEKINNLNDYKTLIKEEKKSKENKNDETSRFRKFRLTEKYEVWVGKDSASNDLLTTRHSTQNDLWFHIRGASGSHTVLKVHNKKEDIPKEIIHSAASIAAYYSKARKASSVPVAYCERKFVKKKKGFKEGSVIMEREKVIFVNPGLPNL